MKAHEMRRKVRDGGLLHRILTIRVERRRWWDWGHMAMTLFGDYRSFDYTVPRGRDLRRRAQEPGWGVANPRRAG